MYIFNGFFLMFLDAALREKLAKIIGSDYLKITPEMKATADVAAEAAGNYSFQVPVQVENSVSQHEQKVYSDIMENASFVICPSSTHGLLSLLQMSKCSYVC